jgi:phospholipase/carboxylesterase
MTSGILDSLRLEPASGAAPKQLVILLHGYGSNAADLISLAPLWQQSLPDALFLAPDAPEEVPGFAGGRQWWALDDRRSAAVAAGVRRAAPLVDAFLEAQLAEHGLAEKDLLLVGFSQGTMMALHAGPRRQQPVAGILGYSGMLADPAGMAGWIRSKPPVLLIHGAADEIVPVNAMQQARTELQRLGFQVEAHVEHGLGHAVDPNGVEFGRRFAKRVLLGE